ncbi:MAG: hypothetical protein AWU57_1491 [Marinobacter sp. T13-3]|nr:MAG: hypothetical protein AWU57_1491 [Marinobacter sp. T13-3]
MAALTALLLITTAFLLWALVVRFKAESRSIEGVMSLSDDAKRYILLAMDQARIEAHEQLNGDHELLAQLVEDEWLDQMSDGVITAGPKTDYIGTRMGRLWSMPENLDRLKRA